MNVTPTLKRPELEMFNAVLGFADALLVNNLGFSGLLDFSVRHAFVGSLSGPEVERLRRVVKFFDDSGKDLDAVFWTPTTPRCTTAPLWPVAFGPENSRTFLFTNTGKHHKIFPR